MYTSHYQPIALMKTEAESNLKLYERNKNTTLDALESIQKCKVSM